MIQKEVDILKCFDNNTKLPNALDFVRFYAYVQKELAEGDLLIFINCAAIILECMTMTPSVWSNKLPSQRGSVAIYLLRRLWGMDVSWPDELKILTNYEEEHVRQCASIFLTLAREREREAHPFEAFWQMYDEFKKDETV